MRFDCQYNYGFSIYLYSLLFRNKRLRFYRLRRLLLKTIGLFSWARRWSFAYGFLHSLSFFRHVFQYYRTICYSIYKWIGSCCLWCRKNSNHLDSRAYRNLDYWKIKFTIWMVENRYKFIAYTTCWVLFDCTW